MTLEAPEQASAPAEGPHGGREYADAPDAPDAPTATPPAEDPPESPDARRATLAATTVNFVLAYATILWHFRPSLLFRRTLATGGDMGSHHYISKAFDEFFPFALGGWASGWFAGMPMTEFYFPLPYLLIWIVENVFGYEVAFKLVTVLGIFALPAVAYLLFKLLDAPRIVAALAPAGAIAFLWIEGREVQTLLGVETAETNLLDIFGGFITSTLAGEFAYSIGLAMTLVTLAFLYRGTRRCDERIPWGWVAAAGTMAGLTAITHVLPMMILVIAVPALIVGRNWLSRLAVVAASAALGAGIAAFWLLPMALQRAYTAPSIWTNETGWHWIVPIWFWPVLPLAALGIGLAIWKRSAGPLVLGWIALGGLLAFFITPHIATFDPIVNGRFLPIWYLMLTLVAAWGLGELANLVSWPGWEWTRAALAVLFAIVIAGILVVQSAKVRPWAEHNYKGYEAQPGWDELQNLMQTLDGLAPGRVMWEYNADYSRFGTPRALENVPFFTDQDTMEGLLIESSASAQAHFYLQGLASTTATGAVPGYPYPALDPSNAVSLMRTFGVRYYVAETPDIVARVDAVPGVEKIATAGRFTVFELEDSSLVNVPLDEPVYMDLDGSDWRDVSWEWLQNEQLRQTPVTFGALGDSGVSDEPLSEFREVDSLEQAGELRPKPEVASGPVYGVEMDDEEISFTTDRIGAPHIIAVSYYPNWSVEGAEGPYLVTPSVMLVIPTDEEVRLTYGTSSIERVGQAVTVVALLVLAFLVYVSWSRRTRARGAGAGTS